MVRALNGKVIKLENPEFHETFNKYVHNIKIMKSSRLYEIVGKEEIKVNSRHHCHASVINTLDVSAYSSDGIVEAVEAGSKKFFIGVQFHPESLYKEDENMNKIFISYIKSCKK